jgi:hypothetical protein
MKSRAQPATGAARAANSAGAPKRAAKPSEPPRAWQRMLSGRRLDLLNPSPFDIEIEDIAHGLARVARWNGQTSGAHAFSVAQHSLLVEDICGRIAQGWPAKWRLAALIHDAPEYVIGDMISPFKTALGLDYKEFEARLEAAIHLRFGLPAHAPAAIKAVIKRADYISAYFEATQLAGFSTDEAKRFFGAPPKAMTLKIVPMETGAVQRAFLKRFRFLLEPS